MLEKYGYEKNSDTTLGLYKYKYINYKRVVELLVFC